MRGKGAGHFSSVIPIATGNLDPGDLRAVRTAIFSARAKWYDIGVELEVSPATLDAIQLDRGNAADCFREMLKEWLSSTSPPPTWSGLIQALSSAPVGEERLAEDIRKQYCHQDGEQDISQASGGVLYIKTVEKLSG